MSERTEIERLQKALTRANAWKEYYRLRWLGEPDAATAALQAADETKPQTAKSLVQRLREYHASEAEKISTLGEAADWIEQHTPAETSRLSYFASKLHIGEDFTSEERGELADYLDRAAGETTTAPDGTVGAWKPLPDLSELTLDDLGLKEDDFAEVRAADTTSDAVTHDTAVCCLKFGLRGVHSAGCPGVTTPAVARCTWTVNAERCLLPLNHEGRHQWPSDTRTARCTCADYDGHIECPIHL